MKIIYGDLDVKFNCKIFSSVIKNLIKCFFFKYKMFGGEIKNCDFVVFIDYVYWLWLGILNVLYLF